MRLTHITIRNFRSIKKCDLKIGNVLALVGENNSGKSAILRALNAFFNYREEEQDFLNGKHLHTQKAKPIIKLTFAGDIKDFSTDTNHDSLTVETIYYHGKRSVKIKTDGKLKSSSEAIIDRIKEKIDYYFIPPIRNHKNLEWAESTAFKRLAEDYLLKATEKRDNYTPKFKAATEFLENNGLDKLARYIREKYNINSKFDFKLAFPDEISFIGFIGGLRFLVNEKNSIHEMSECGAGVQSLTIIALHRALAAINNRSIILGLEEPETNLHPQAQREVIRSLIRNIQDADDSIAQVVFTTHSTIMIDSVDHTEVALFQKVEDAIRGIKTEVTQLPSDFYEKYALEEHKYYQFHHYRNSDFFYSKLVVIVESKNDAQAIQEIMKKDGIELDDLGVSIVNLESINNLKYVFSLVREIGLPYLLVVDKDFFVPYENDELDASRDSKGFPKYRKEYVSERVDLFATIISVKKDRDDLLGALINNHTEALKILSSYHTVCMKWGLEVDLIGSSRGRELFYTECKIPQNKRNAYELLVNNKKSIKGIDKIAPVIRALPKNNYPRSFSKIRELLTKKLAALA